MSKSQKNTKGVTISNPMPQRKTLYALAAGTAIAILFGIYLSAQKISPQPGSGYQAPPAAVQLGSVSALASVSPLFDFGKISMAAGNVSHRYWIKNVSGDPLTITKLSTSCMCTVATLITHAGKKGPFGMAGHGPAPRLAERLAPGETAQVEVVFDPAAHGPAGIGQTDRIVTIGNDAGPSLELRFSALVTP
ncbi:MAG: DUF1573 domain-containing protein [Pseudomonadota bacterium]